MAAAASAMARVGGGSDEQLEQLFPHGRVQLVQLRRDGGGDGGERVGDERCE